eukprot:TRINITY_DN30597_c0_g1_i1.p1 TRINITY_DN30597_c0_g1~~TRINITY_DN30597_c0_g1_i1.p1  ORF type:complete len:1889 (+),score=442.87 TRINITY_DN30597_c0_g1_i1:197-5863(+)
MTAAAAEGEDLADRPPETEAECVQEIVYCLLDAKGGALSTPSVQVAINASVIQVAKANFQLVVTSIFSCLEQKQGSEAHQLGLLRLLCQVLETRRSCDDNDSGGGVSACTVDLDLALQVVKHLVTEVASLPGEDSRLEAISDVLVELAPIHPDAVLNAVLAKLDNPGSFQHAPASLVKILTEIAYTTPHACEGRLHDIMSRYLPLLQSCKAVEMKLMLFRAWCSMCVAMVNCATCEHLDAMSSNESTFSRSFGSAALALRRSGSDATPSGAVAARAAAGGTQRSTARISEDSEDRRKATQALGSAFTILMSSWQSSKDLSARIGAMETLGHLSLVIAKDQFLTNADSLLELLVNLLTRQSSTTPGLPPMRLMRGLCLFLQSCIDADPEILLLEQTLQTLISTLFGWMVTSGPLQCLQGSIGTESLQSQAEVLRCFEVLAETFRSEVLDFMLAKVKGTRDEKLGALLVLRHLIGGSSWRPKPAAVVEGVQHLTNDSDPAVGLLLGELVAALAGADYFQVPELGATSNGTTTATDEGGPAIRLDHIHNLLSFLINQTALTQTAEPEQPSYVARSLMLAKSQPTDIPSCSEVRGRAGLVLGHLAGSLKPSVRLILWPMLLQAMVSPMMRPGLPVLCRVVAQIVQGVRGSGEGSARGLTDLRAAFQPKHEKSTQPEALLVWLLICAHSPFEVPGLGLAILRCLESLSPLLHRVLGEIWEAPSKRLQTLCTYLEENSAPSRFDSEFWSSALSQEVHFFLSALPEHEDLPTKLVDILGALHTEVWRKDRDISDLSELQKAALFNLTGVCLSHVGTPAKVNSTLEFILSHSSDLIADQAVRRACARGLGIAAQRHFDLVLGVLGKAAKTDAATRRAGSIAQSLFGKSAAVQQAEYLRAMLALALGYCAIYAPSPEVLQEKGSVDTKQPQICEHILAPLHSALTQEKALPVLLNVTEAIRLANDAMRMAPEALAQRDPFLSKAERERSASEELLSQDPALRNALGIQRDDLVRALLPFLETPGDQDDEQRVMMFEELICPALNATSSLISLPLDLPSDLYASILEAGLHVLILSIPNDTSSLRQGANGDDVLRGVEPALAARIHAVTRLIESLLFHAHSWLGVSRLLQAVHAAGASCPVEFIRWTCTQLLGVLCKAAPILDVPQAHEEEVHTDVGDWCECLALLLPRTGDSCRPVVVSAVDAVQQLLSRCEWTSDVRLGEVAAGQEQTQSSKTPASTAERPPPTLERHGDSADGPAAPGPPSQQLVAALVSRLPPSAIPPLVQHLMPAMHDADSRAALSGVDALYLILQACSEKLSGERATNLISTVFEEVEKVSHSSVRQRVLSCIKVLALHHFESAVSELLDTGPEFNTSILGALQVLAKEKALLLRLLNHFTDTLNNSDPGTQKRPNRLVLAATVALGHLFTVNDSSIGMVVKKYFPQLFGTFLLRIGTTVEGLSAQQTAAAFMNFLHASQNDSMAMALEGNRLSRVTRDLYDEVISELAALFCRHHPSKREALLQFIHPFLARPFAGHRVATVSALAQLLASGVDGSLGASVVTQIVQSLLRCVGDAHSTVRKQAMRGLGQFVLLLQQRSSEAAQADEEIAVRHVLPALCQALTDSCFATQREAVLALQRACQVDDLHPDWQPLLLRSAKDLHPLFDACDVSLRGASFDLLGRLCKIAGPPPPADDIPEHRVEFSNALQLLLVDCVIRLEDAASGVAAAAHRCLGHLVGAVAFGGGGLENDLAAASAARAEAKDLLQRQGEELIGFEQFVFPFVALVHRSEDPDLTARRLETCRTHFLSGRPEASEANGSGSSGSAFSLSTCVAAGFVAAAFVRCIGDKADASLSSLLCQVCRDLVDLVAVEDSEFRAQVARILGFFDILARRALTAPKSPA